MQDTINEVIEKSAKVRKLDPMQTAICIEATLGVADLLTNHFKDVESVRKDNKTMTANVSFGIIIGYDNGAAYVKHNIGFAKKYSDERTATVGDPDQRDFVKEQSEGRSAFVDVPTENVDSEGEEEVSPKKRSKKSKS